MVHSFQGGIILKLTDFRKVANVISVAFVGSVVVFFLFATLAFITGCGDPVIGPAVKPIVDEVVDTDEPNEPMKPAVNGGVKEPEEPTGEDPVGKPAEEPAEEPEPEPEPEEPAEQPPDTCLARSGGTRRRAGS